MRSSEQERTEHLVQSVSSETASPQYRGHRAANGIPAPEERLLDISELVRHLGMRYVHQFALPPFVEGDFHPVSPITGTITLSNTGAVLLLEGAAEASLHFECGRCLEPSAHPVRAELSEEFPLQAVRNAFQQEEVQAVDEDVPAAVIRGNILDLGELLRQNLLLEAPVQPLCREDCPGIAPPAAEDLSEDSADDNPLRRLKDLLEARQRESGTADTAEQP